MFRKAVLSDLDAIDRIYDRTHTLEEKGQTSIGWVRSIYPTRSTALAAIEKGDMFVLEENGCVVACGRINREQVPEYADAAWEYEAPDEKVCVLHTLVVDPLYAGHGYGPAFVAFYESYAKENSMPFLRMDTNARNTRARRLYAKLGYKEVSIVSCIFNGISGVSLVCLEKKL